MVALAPSSPQESYAEPSPYAWLRSRTPIPTTYAPACEPLYPFQHIFENRTSRARGMTGSCAEVVERTFAICIEIWQFELESCVWRVSFHKYAYVHGDPIQGIDPTGKFLGILIGAPVGGYLRGSHGAAVGAAYGFLVGLLADAVFESTRNLTWALGLSANPVRGLTSKEKKVLTFIHTNTRPDTQKNYVDWTLSSVKLYNGSDLGIGDQTSAWGYFAKSAIDGSFNPPAGAVTIGTQIYFSSPYAVSKELVPSRNGSELPLLAHETTHALQSSWKESFFGPYSFAPSYLADTVSNGYRESIAEIEGYAVQKATEKLLIAYPNIVQQVIQGNQPAAAAVDLKQWYQTEEANLRKQYGR